MLQIMFIIFIFVGKYSHYKAECSSHHAENTFLCMRLNPRGLTPSETGMDDRYEDEKSQKQYIFLCVCLISVCETVTNNTFKIELWKFF